MKASTLLEPKPLRTFRDKYLAVVMMAAALLICSVVSAQMDSLKYSQINGYGFKYKRHVQDSVSIVPLSTSPHTPYRAGGIRYRASDSTLQLWTGYQWNSIVTGVGNGIDTAYMINDSTLTIETPDQDFFFIIPGRHWDLQGVLNNGSALTENEVITLADSLTFTSGVVIIDTLNLPNLATSADSTTYKPVAINTSGDVVKLASWPGGGLSPSDTTNKWVNDVYVRNDTVFKFKNGSETFVSVGIDRLSTRVYYITKNGGISDADVSVGSSTMGTNNTTVIQGILNNAATGPIEVVVDGAFSVDSLKIYGNTKLRGLNPGDGIIQRPGINYPMLINQNRTLGTISDSNIVIEDIILNGNGYNTSAVTQREYYGTHGWNFVLRFTGAKNVLLNNIRIENGRTISAFASNVQNFTVTNSVINASPYITSDSLIHDGIKFDGPASDITLSNLKIYSIDDAISFCPNDGFFPTDSIVFGYHTYDPYATFGKISNAYVENITLDSCYHGFRMLTTSEDLDNIVFKNIKGYVSDYLFVLDDYLGGNPNYKDGSAASVGSIVFEDVDIGLNVTTNYANAGAYVNLPVDNLYLRNFTINRTDVNDYPAFLIGSPASISNITFDNWSFSETSAIVRPVISITGGTVTSASLNNFRFYRASSGDEPILSLSGGTLTNLYASGLRTNNVLKQIKYSGGGTGTNATLNSINHLNGDVTFNTTIPVAKLVVSNYAATSGTTITGGVGTISSATGDAFQTIAPAYISIKGGATGVSDLILTDAAALGSGHAWLLEHSTSHELQHVYYNPAGGTYTNWLNITTGGLLGTMGKIGIGTHAPGELLDITGNIPSGSTTGNAVRIRMQNTSTTDGYAEFDMRTDISRILLGSAGTGSSPFGFTAGGGYLGTVTNHPFIFATNSIVRASIANSGAITFGLSTNSYTFPTTRASAGQVLTDVSGTGAVTWQTPSGATTIYTGDGTLSGNRTVSTGGFTTTWSGSNDNETSFSVTNSGTTSASAIAGNASGATSVGVTGSSTSYLGVFGSSTSNTGVQGQSSSGVGVIGVSSTGAAIRGQINPSSNSTIEYATTILRTSSSGAGANNMGTGTQYELETATSGTSQIAGSIAFAWDDATNATRTSRYEVYGVNSGTSARKAALLGTGQWIWDTYGAGTHSVTPATTPVISSSGVIGERIAPKIYTALLSATAGNAPTASVMGTNEIGSIVWTRVADGNYTGTLSSAFTANKTWALVQRGDMAGNFVNNWISSGTTSTVTLTVNDNVGNPVGDFTNMSIEIRVYP